MSNAKLYKKYRDIIGKTILEAKILTGLRIREIEENGRGLIVTADFWPDRLNVALKDGVISEVICLG